MFLYLETAISFALVMLVASLMVNVAVRVLYTLRGQRAQGVQGMLRQLHRGFCDERGIGLYGKARAAAEQAFLNDVLGSPVLHSGAAWAKAMAIFDADMAKADDAWKRAGLSATRDKAAIAQDPKTADLAKAARALEDQAYADRAAFVAGRIESISKGDLLAIIRSCSTDAGRDDARSLPPEWFGGAPQLALPPTRAQQRQFSYHQGLAAGTVNARDFHDYCDRWFPTVEANATAQFGADQRSVARSVAGLVVVLLNLDAIHLAYDLYQNRSVSDALAGRATEIVQLANQIQTDKPDVALAQSQQELSKAAAILTTEHVPIGWNDSYIAKRWCAYQGACSDPTVAVPTRTALELDLVLWVFGLLASWVLLSLGAPFWVSVIEKVTGLANLMSGAPDDDHKGEERAWTIEGAGDATTYDPAASSAGLPRQQPVSGKLAPRAAAPATTVTTQTAPDGNSITTITTNAAPAAPASADKDADKDDDDSGGGDGGDAGMPPPSSPPSAPAT